ncbi:hypothetical protein [Sorangium sp. So ce1099]|uniref:hypothetical protein n=1 Tax=Sorangium sp. So ce1099 TaxID=3133331 RepID=UPI003F5E9945
MPASIAPPHPATRLRESTLQAKAAEERRPPHPATVAQKPAPHPATVAQRRMALPPHPATVMQEPAPHPATVAQRRMALPPHPATVMQEPAPHPATVAQRRMALPPHPATVAQRKAMPPATWARLHGCTAQRVVGGGGQFESQEKLEELQSRCDGSTQGTLALFKVKDDYYAIEQETNSKVSDECKKHGIAYIYQGRKSGFHAEMRFIKHAKEKGIDIDGAQVWVSKPICKDCARVLRENNLMIQTSCVDESYRNWIDPFTLETSTAIERPVGTFRGRRSEAERLKDAAKNWFKDAKDEL